MGKRQLAIAWAYAAVDTTPQVIEPDEKNTISIDAIRELYRYTRARGRSRQIVIIDHAEYLSGEAQNAFLKLLEEPNARITFVLTAPRRESLLPTVISRVQSVTVQPLSEAVLRTYITQHQPAIEPSQVVQLLFIAQGRPGYLARLLSEPTALETHINRMQQAKLLLTASPFERYACIGRLTGDRAGTQHLLEAMMGMVHLQLRKACEPATLRHWLALSNALEQTARQIANNGNVKAQLLRLFASY